MVRERYVKISPDQIAKMVFQGVEKEHTVRCTVDDDRDEVRCTIDGDVTITISEAVLNKIAISRLQPGRFVVSEPYREPITSMRQVWVEWV